MCVAPKLLKSSSRLTAANGAGIRVKGKSVVEFKILGSDKIWEHTAEVVEEDGAPNILGVDFWEPLETIVNMPGRVLEVRHPSGTMERIPVSLMRKEEAAVACSINVAA